MKRALIAQRDGREGGTRLIATIVWQFARDPFPWFRPRKHNALQYDLFRRVVLIEKGDAKFLGGMAGIYSEAR